MRLKPEILINNNLHNNNRFINPYPGLRPFSIEESNLFFGREEQSKEVVNRLLNFNFCAVTGSSGSGKSSLINCGVIPFFKNIIRKNNKECKIISTKPGNNPIDNLVRNLIGINGNTELSDEKTTQYNDILNILLSGKNGLVESIKYLKPYVNEYFLIIFDQFEELFRYKRSQKDIITYNISDTYVKLITEALNNKNFPLYVIISLRSEYIGECSQFNNLTELINQSNYLVPQMTKENFKRVIIGPLSVAGVTIEETLVNHLLEEIGDKPYQLPLLQHALMRTWNHWITEGEDKRPIGIKDYEAIGKMEKAISDHANEAFDELSERGKELCSKVFKVITEKGIDNIGIRRPTKLLQIAEIINANINDVIEVVDTFRKPGRSFLTPSYDIKLTEDSIIDISHESLMRIWDKLQVWVEEEAISVQTYLRLSEAAELYQLGKTGILRPPELFMAISWRDTQKPNIEWAKRYNPALERTLVYIEVSEYEYKAEENNKIKLQKVALQRTRLFAIILGLAVVVSLAFTIFAIMQSIEAKNQQIEADRQRRLGEEQRKIAEQQKEEAEKQKLLAIQNAIDLQKQKQIADIQKYIALKNEEEAKKQKELAKYESQEAIKQRLIADSIARIAMMQQKIAEQASAQALRLRMLSIAQSMAIKSLQINDDLNLKALLAYQAYSFNKDYDGNVFNADIFNGLLFSLKAFKPIDFNKFKAHSDNVISARFLNDNKSFITAGNDGLIIKCKIADENKNCIILYKNSFPYRKMQISPDGNTIACLQTNNFIQIFDISKGVSFPKELQNPSEIVNDIVFIDNKLLLSASSDKSILLWNINNLTYEKITDLNSNPKVIAYSYHNNKVAAACDDGALIVINLNNKTVDTLIYNDKEYKIMSIAYNKKGTFLAGGDMAGYIHIWYCLSSKKEKSLQFKAHNSRVSYISFSHDDEMLASSSYEGNIKLWNTNDFNLQPYTINEHNSWVFGVDFSADDNTILSYSADKTCSIIPINSDNIAAQISKFISRNFTNEEWATYVGKDLKYQTTLELPKSKK
jgi:WD40 repeat protein